jgi:hypothetical protein
MRTLKTIKHGLEMLDDRRSAAAAAASAASAAVMDSATARETSTNTTNRTPGNQSAAEALIFNVTGLLGEPAGVSGHLRHLGAAARLSAGSSPGPRRRGRPAADPNQSWAAGPRPAQDGHRPDCSRCLRDIEWPVELDLDEEALPSHRLRQRQAGRRGRGARCAAAHRPPRTGPGGGGPRRNPPGRADRAAVPRRTAPGCASCAARSLQRPARPSRRRHRPSPRGLAGPARTGPKAE